MTDPTALYRLQGRTNANPVNGHPPGTLLVNGVDANRDAAGKWTARLWLLPNPDGLDWNSRPPGDLLQGDLFHRKPIPPETADLVYVFPEEPEGEPPADEPAVVPAHE